MNTTATKVSYSRFESDFDNIASFYYDGHFTKVDEDGLVYCYSIDDYIPCDVVFDTMCGWKSIYVFFKDDDYSYIGMSLTRLTIKFFSKSG